MTSSHLARALLSTTWRQWAAVGVSATEASRSLTVVDLEALVLTTFEVARDDPRLFDESLDWLHTNATLLSTNRLRNLCADDLDHRLADSALAWLAAHGRGARRASKPTPATSPSALLQLFPADDPRASELDSSYAAYGIARRTASPSGKSRGPDLLRPECFALRLRTLFGNGPKAEVLRTLLTSEPPRLEYRVLTASAGYSDRRVREAIADLVRAGFVTESRLPGAAFFAIERGAWWSLMAPAHASEESGDNRQHPRHYEWPQLLEAARRLVRWERTADDDYPSPYLRASAARQLWDEIAPLLHFAGVALVSAPFSPGEEYLEAFDHQVAAVTRHLGILTA